MGKIKVALRPGTAEFKRALNRVFDFQGTPQLKSAVAPKRERKRRTVADGPSEHQEQVAVIQWWYGACNFYGLPHFALFAIPNGSARDVITGSRLKSEGVRPGAPDLMLARRTSEYAGLFIEMKVGDNKPSERQKEMIGYLLASGYLATVHWTADSAIAEIKEYLE